MNPSLATLYYFHDPMCSWCWALKDTFQQLCDHLPENIQVKRILGGLAQDSDEPMTAELREQVMANWSRIEAMIPGVKFNFAFWQECQPRRSTYAACRAVIAARLQDEQYDERMTSAIQQAYYQQARNPSNDATLIELASEIGLERQAFINDFYSDRVKSLLQQEIDFSRDMFVESFPALALKVGNHTSGIEINYTDYQVMLKQIKEKLDAVH